MLVIYSDHGAKYICKTNQHYVKTTYSWMFISQIRDFKAPQTK